MEQITQGVMSSLLKSGRWLLMPSEGGSRGAVTSRSPSHRMGRRRRRPPRSRAPDVKPLSAVRKRLMFELSSWEGKVGGRRGSLYAWCWVNRRSSPGLSIWGSSMRAMPLPLTCIELSAQDPLSFKVGRHDRRDVRPQRRAWLGCTSSCTVARETASGPTATGPLSRRTECGRLSMHMHPQRRRRKSAMPRHRGC